MTANIDIKDCCTFEAKVKGVMFYPGYLELNPVIFQRVTIVRDSKNMQHNKAYWVKFAHSNVKLGHLDRNTAEAWYHVTKIPTVKYTG